MEIRTIRDDELAGVSAWLAGEQADPTRHIGYLATDAGAIADGLAELEPNGLADALVALDAGRIVGFLAAEHDREPPRVWWHGPFVRPGHDFAAIADALHAAACGRLPAHVTEQELGPDARHVEVEAFARRHGFVAEEPSAVLVRRLGGDDDPDRRPAGAPPTGTTIAPLDGSTAPAVAALHDLTFPGTHRSGRSLTEPGEGQVVLVASRGTAVVGYVAVERQEDGSGYVDYLGVAPEGRRGGLGRALVAAGCGWLRDELGCPEVSLTVRASNTGARGLYEHLGFDEERLLLPWRRGFSLTHLDAPPA